MKVRSLCPWFCAMLLLAASAIPVRAQSDATDAERQFLWQEANAAAARANTPEDYLRVAAKYQQLGDMGARNGTLFYNMGTVLLGAGQYEQAWQALLRAERYLGNTGDLQQNLALAFARRSGQDTPTLPWYRVLLFWHFGLAAPVRGAVACAAFAIVCLLLAWRTARRNRALAPLLVVAAIVFILFGSSYVTTLAQEAHAPRLVLTLKP